MNQQTGESTRRFDDIEDVVKDIMDVYETRLRQLDRHTYDWFLQYQNEVFKVILEAPDYWWYGENGRRAGKMPPQNAILQWIKIKRIVPRAINGKIPSQQQLAFLIARKIGRDGVIGKRPWHRSLEDADSLGKLDELHDAVFKYLVTSIEDELEKMTKK